MPLAVKLPKLWTPASLGLPGLGSRQESWCPPHHHRSTELPELLQQVHWCVSAAENAYLG
jgi:hypothetical protein